MLAGRPTKSKKEGVGRKETKLSQKKKLFLEHYKHGT